MSIEYKYKPNKHKYRVNIKTIDEIHKERTEEFKRKRAMVPEMKKELSEHETELKCVERENINKPSNIDIELLKKKNNLKNNIRKLKEEIENIENYKLEMDYYGITGDILYDYYNQTNGLLYNQNFEEERKANIFEVQEESDNLTKTQDAEKTSKIAISEELMAITNSNRKRKLKRPIRKRNKKIDLAPTKDIMSYLLGKHEDSDEGNEKENDIANSKCRATLQDEYLLMMDKEYACSKTKMNLVRKCRNPNCKGIDKIIVYNESIMTCPKCGESDDIFIESDVPSYRESFNEKPKYPYKRIGHCIEKLNQFLCKGTANIPPDVYLILEEEVEKHGITNDKITTKFIERMLKKHRLSDYYEYIMFIYSKMTNTPPPTISREEYELVLKMFGEVDEIYEKKFKPKTRNNFLKYTVVLNKIFLKIGKPEIAKHFKLLKSPIKMKEQEGILRQICSELGWDETN